MTPGKTPSVAEIITTALPHLSNGREITPFRALAQFFDKVEVRTRVTPPVVIDVASLDDSGPPSAATRYVKPTVILSGPAGRKVIAPHGEAGSLEGRLTPLLILGGVFAVGVAVGRRQRRRRN